MKSINPYLNYNGNTEEAFNFYQSVFGGDLQITRYKDLGDNMGATGDEENKIANVTLLIGNGTMLMGTDTLESMGQILEPGNNFYINLEAESVEETERLFNELSSGGKVEMPLQETEWAKKFGMFTDKYGTRWMVNYAEAQTV